jgi:hypothetical protein
MTDNTSLHLTFVRAPDDHDYFGPVFQAELGTFISMLEAEGVEVSYGHAMFDDVKTVGGIVGEFALPLAGIICPIIGVALGAWITGRAGRKLKLKIGDVELEANSLVGIDHLVIKAQEFRKQLDESVRDN